MNKLVLAACLLAVVVVGVAAKSTGEDYSLRWNFVHPKILGNLPAEKALFSTWKHKMNRSYSSTGEEAFRFSLFQNSLARVVAKNAKLPAGKSNHGLNKFSDMDPAEWANMYLNKKVSSPKKQEILDQATIRIPNMDIPLPAGGIDWRQLNAVTAVKDQGQCGSCWAFSVVETVESQWAIKQKATNYDLAPQQIVDCDWGDGNMGCDGGDPSIAYVYVMKNGLMSDDDYPYVSGDSGINGTCEYDAAKVQARISNFTFATPPCWNGSCDHQNDIMLAQNIAQHGPAGIIVDASQWQDYTWGTFDDCSCDYADMDHGVQVVGFEILQKEPLPGLVDTWIVRNSWGEDWGDQGYIELGGSSVAANMCGISNEAIYADL